MKSNNKTNVYSWLVEQNMTPLDAQIKDTPLFILTNSTPAYKHYNNENYSGYMLGSSKVNDLWYRSAHIPSISMVRYYKYINQAFI